MKSGGEKADPAIAELRAILIAALTDSIHPGRDLRLNSAVQKLKEELGVKEARTPGWIFYPLFCIATDSSPGDGADYVASRLLVELEPQCPLNCEDALRLLDSGCWQVSDTLVPFYLTIQFGARAVREAVQVVAAESRAAGREDRSRAVAHHLEWPSLMLVDGYVLERNAHPRSSSVSSNESTIDSAIDPRHPSRPNT